MSSLKTAIFSERLSASSANAFAVTVIWCMEADCSSAAADTCSLDALYSSELAANLCSIS
ncbi:MAG: hypothetical protein ACW99R_15575 [Candidatus Hodarchaeales archaeon]